MGRPARWNGRHVYYTASDYPRVLWPEHPMAKSDGMVRIHRAVAAEAAGRPLRPSEHVHHKNGVRNDWRADNLEICSPTEHRIKHAVQQRVTFGCASCGMEVVRVRSHVRGEKSYCSHKCAHKATERTRYPDNDELAKWVWREPLTAIAVKLGVSDKALAKRCKIRKISTPGRGYWSKRR
jgi:predicted RNA-binding Zn-ribbon protein involved in translation (DUF1610 family)